MRNERRAGRSARLGPNLVHDLALEPLGRRDRARLAQAACDLVVVVLAHPVLPGSSVWASCSRAR